MKPRTLFAVTLSAAGLLAASRAGAERLWTLQLTGGAVVLSLDPPEERGGMLVFHLAPDGTFSSLRADSVERISIASGPAKKTRPSLAGLVLILGHDLDAEEREELTRSQLAPSLPPPQAPYDEIVYGSAYGRSEFSLRPGVPLDRVTPLARPNGFPSVSAGTFGFESLPIGPNGFPILGGLSAAPVRPSPAPRVPHRGHGHRLLR